MEVKCIRIEILEKITYFYNIEVLLIIMKNKIGKTFKASSKIYENMVSEFYMNFNFCQLLCYNNPIEFFDKFLSILNLVVDSLKKN